MTTTEKKKVKSKKEIRKDVVGQIDIPEEQGVRRKNVSTRRRIKGARAGLQSKRGERYDENQKPIIWKNECPTKMSPGY